MMIVVKGYTKRTLIMLELFNMFCPTQWFEYNKPSVTPQTKAYIRTLINKAKLGRGNSASSRGHHHLLAYDRFIMCFDDYETHFTHRSDFTFSNSRLWVTWNALINIRFYVLKCKTKVLELTIIIHLIHQIYPRFCSIFLVFYSSTQEEN